MSASIPEITEALPEPPNLSTLTGLMSVAAAPVACGYELTLVKESFDE